MVLERNEIVDQMEEERVQDQKEIEESTDMGVEDVSSETSEGQYMYNVIIASQNFFVNDL